jgi:uncharacterized Tic20 family protein
MKKNSSYVDHHGRQTINFQLSLFLYSLVLFTISVPILLTTIFQNIPFSAMVNGDDVFIENFSAANITGIVTVAIIAAVIFFFLKVAEFFLIIYASVKAANGERYVYPLTINFLGTANEEAPIEPAAPMEVSEP